MTEFASGHATNLAVDSAGPFGYRTSGHSATSSEFLYLSLNNSIALEESVRVTVSFDLEMTVATANPSLSIYNTNWRGPMEFSASESATTGNNKARLSFKAAVGETVSERVAVTGWWHPRQSLPVDRATNKLDLYSIYGTGNYFTVSNVMFELGEVAHPWSPSPFDEGVTGVIYASDSVTIGDDTTLESRVTAAETSIAQNKDAIALSAKRLETVANPNLTPFFEMPVTATTDGYWMNVTFSRITRLGDGWAHFEYSNSGTSTVNNYIKPRALDSLVPGGTYTLLLEFRNVSISASGGSIYSQQDSNAQVWGATAYGGFSVSNADIMALEGGEGRFHKVLTPLDADSKDPSGTVRGRATKTELMGINWQVVAGQSISADLRLSLYEGEYTGPYKPYSGSQLYASQAELKVTADEVSSKVSKDGVISSINQSAESVRIQASRVEIDGAAVFSAISSDVNSAITGKGYATTSQAQGYANTARTEAISAAATDATNKANVVQQNLDNLEIGGRNLLAISDRKGGATSSKGLSAVYESDGWIHVTGTVTGTAAGILCFWGTSTVTNHIYEAGTYTLSVENDGLLVSGRFGIQLYGQSPSGTNTYVTVEDTGSVTKEFESHVSRVCLWVAANATGTVVDGRVRLKLERGNRATDWTPAPEDTEAAIAAAQSTADAAAPKTAAVSEEQLIYRSAASGTASMAATTTWVTASGDTQNAWTLKRPTYSGSYPVLFVAKQRKTVSGAVTCTTPVKDDTTTVIDGGHITTGTIDATKVAVTKLDASNITSGTLSADRIAAGSLAVGKLDTAVATSSDLEALGADVGSLAGDIGDVSDVASGARKVADGAKDSADAANDKVDRLAAAVYADNGGWMTFGDGGMSIGRSGSAQRVEIDNEELRFMAGGSVAASASSEGFEAPVMRSDESHVGAYMWVARSNGHISLKYVG